MVRTLQGLASELLDGLAEAERRAAADVQTGGREGALYAIAQVCDFVMEAARRLPEPRDQAEMLSRKTVLDSLAFALIGLQHGTVAPVLRRNQSQNAPPLSMDILLARGRAAAAMEVLCLSGEQVAAAAKLVANHIDGRDEIARTGRDEPWKTVQKWRSDIKKAGVRPRLDEISKNQSGAHIAIFDEMMRYHDQLLAEGKSAPDQRRQFAYLMLDQGHVPHSREGASKRER